MASAYEMMQVLADDPALKLTMTEVALIATATAPEVPLEKAIYDRLSPIAQNVVNEYPSHGELSSLHNFFETLFATAVLDHAEDTPTPSHPISVGVLGEFLVDDYFSNQLVLNT